jgi:ABC-type transport system involved in multi-copper enzyme maturation permease subunit
LAVLSIGPLAIVGKLSGLSGWLAHFLTTLSPLSALQQITGTQSKVAELGITSGWVEFLWGAAVVTVICAAATLTKLDPILLDRTKSRGRVRLADDPEGSRFRRFQYLVDPEKRSAGIPRWLNPVLVKEFRTRRFGRLHWLIRIVAVCAILSLILTVVSASGTVNWGVQRIAAMMVLMQVAMLLLLGPSLSSSLIAGEIESGGWQILRTTPLRPMRILSGKFMSVVWTVLLLLLATLPGYVVMGFIVPAMVGQVNNVLLSLILVAWVVISVSACVSAFARNTAVATIISYVLLILLFAGTLVVWLARGKPFGPILVERVLTFNPVATALAEIKAPGFEGYQLAPASWWISAGISLGCTLILMIRTWQLSRSD